MFAKIIVWGFFICTLSWMLKAFFLGLYPDFSVYYYGSKIYLSGQNPYLSGQKLFSGYSYPPTVFLLFAPFILLTFQNAENLWLFLNVLFLFASLIFLTKIFSIKFFSNTNLILAGLTFISFPVKFTLGMGQINNLILLLLVVSLLLLKKKREFYSGFFLGLSLGIKIFPLFLPLYFLIKGKQKILLGLLSCVVMLTIIVLFFVPVKVYLTFVKDVFPYFFSSSWKLEYYSQSLSAFVGRTFGTGELGNIIKFFLTLQIVITTLFVILKTKQKSFCETSLMFGFLITATMLVNTFSWQHHFVWLIIPFYATFFYMMRGKHGKREFILLGISYFLVVVNFKYPATIPAIFLSHVFYGTLILFFIEARLLFLKKQK